MSRGSVQPSPPSRLPASRPIPSHPPTPAPQGGGESRGGGVREDGLYKSDWDSAACQTPLPGSPELPAGPRDHANPAPPCATFQLYRSELGRIPIHPRHTPSRVVY